MDMKQEGTVICMVLVPSNVTGQAREYSGPDPTGASNAASLETEPRSAQLTHCLIHTLPWLLGKPCCQEVGWWLAHMTLPPLLGWLAAAGYGCLLVDYSNSLCQQFHQSPPIPTLLLTEPARTALPYLSPWTSWNLVIVKSYVWTRPLLIFCSALPSFSILFFSCPLKRLYCLHTILIFVLAFWPSDVDATACLG